jgi:hypothetical protein
MPDLTDTEAFRRQRKGSVSNSKKNVCPNRLLTEEGRRLLRRCTEFFGRPPRYRGAGDREIYFKWTYRPRRERWMETGRGPVWVPPRTDGGTDAPALGAALVLADYLQDAAFPRPRVVACSTFGRPAFKRYFPVRY